MCAFFRRTKPVRKSTHPRTAFCKPRLEALEDRVVPSTRVFFSDFNSGVPPEFSGVTTTESVQGYAGVGTGSNVFSGNFLRNQTGGGESRTPGSPTILTLTNLPAHTSIDVNFLFAAIDSWDSVADIFTVKVDGVPVFRENFENAFGSGQGYLPPAGVQLGPRVQRGFTTSPQFYLDAAYNMGFEPKFHNIPHTSSTLSVEWFASGSDVPGVAWGWQGSFDESWGMDNVEVRINGAADIAPTSLTWNTAQAGVDFGYKVSGSDLTQDTTATLYWSSSENFADAIGGPVYSTTIEHPVGDYGPFYVPNSVLGTPPTGATHLLLVTDPPDATHPNGLIDETDETNNVMSLAIPDIVMQSAQLIDANTVQFTYETMGNPGPFEVGLYRSADGLNYDPTDPIATQTITPSPTNPQTPGTFTLPSDYSAQGKPYLIVVADPNDLISESNPNNNTASLRLPDLEAVSLNATRLLGNDFLFTYTYRITGSALPADTKLAFYWSDNNTFESNRDTLAFELPIRGFNRAIGEYTRTLVLSKPPGARYLLLVLDPPTFGGSQGQIMEADETNNVKAVPAGANVPDGPGGDDDDDLPPGAKFPNLEKIFEEIFKRIRRRQFPFPPPGLPGWFPRGRPF